MSDEELEAQTLVELPDREAMSIVGLPGGPIAGLPMSSVPIPGPVEPTIDPGQG